MNRKEFFVKKHFKILKILFLFSVSEKKIVIAFSNDKVIEFIFIVVVGHSVIPLTIFPYEISSEIANKILPEILFFNWSLEMVN